MDTINSAMEIVSVQTEEDFFYGVAADTSFVFNNGATIRANKYPLACRSSVFRQMFYGPLHDTNGCIEIKDFGSRTFKLFLDCLMGFKQLTSDNALVIFPLVDKYDTSDLKHQCIKNLKPKVMDEEACHILNLSVFYNCQDLLQETLQTMRKYGITKILVDENYGAIFEPDSVFWLIDGIKQSGSLIKAVLTWGRKYLQRNGEKDQDFRSFLTKHKIMEKLSLSCFHNSPEFVKFYKSDLAKDVFSDSQIVAQHEKISYNVHSLLHRRKFQWFKLVARKRIKEVIPMRPYIVKTPVKIAVQMNGVLPCVKKCARHCSKGRCIECMIVVHYSRLREEHCTSLLLNKMESCSKGISYPIFYFKSSSFASGCNVQINQIEVTYMFSGAHSHKVLKTTWDHLDLTKSKTGLYCTSSVAFLELKNGKIEAKSEPNNSNGPESSVNEGTFRN